MSRLLVFVAALAFAQAGGALREEPFLDLTRFEPPKTPRGVSWVDGIGVTVSHGVRVERSRPLELELLGLDKSAYSLEEAFVFEVRIRNISDRAARILWNPGWSKFPAGPDDEPPSGYRAAGIGIFVLKNPPNEPFKSSYSLFGSSDVASSFLSLKPGATARIRGEGKWDFIGPHGDYVGPEPPARIRVQAMLNFIYGSATDDLYAVRRFHSNTLELELLP